MLRTRIAVLLLSSFGIAFVAAAMQGNSGSEPGNTVMLETQLLKESPASLAKAAREKGDPTRGALLFHQPQLACTKCHSTGEKLSPLGPDLSQIGKEAKDVYLVESLLKPSQELKKGFEPVTIVTTKGITLTGLVVKDTPAGVELLNASGQKQTIPSADISEKVPSKVSIMPTGLVNQLASREQFLDLVRYLMDIAEGGALRAQELRPPESFFASLELPEYEKDLDHAGLINDLNQKSFQRGETIYKQVCMSCHGTPNGPGSMPTSLAFAKGKFKNGSDPYSMYQTLSHGFGMMAPQIRMVPQQKYDAIHYIREAYLKKFNPTQYAKVDGAYLGKLPKGKLRGPVPVNQEPWTAMNYGPNLIATYEIGRDGSNFAYKGIAVRLDPGPGGVAHGKYWMVFDQDTMRVAGAWSGKGFMDWNAILFNGAHAVHPHITGQVHLANPSGPGWANPKDDSFAEVRLVGKDGKRYGPLPHSWAHYKGLYHFGDKVIVSYTVGDTKVLEMPGLEATTPAPVFSRTFHVGPRAEDMILQVAHLPGATLQLMKKGDDSVAVFGRNPGEEKVKNKDLALKFDGKSYLEVAKAAAFDLKQKDYTIFARIKTTKGGSIFCKTLPGPKWVPDGKSLFVRGGRLVFDIGWVGAVTSKRAVDDNQWHEVAMTWENKTGLVRLYIDGKLDKQGKLEPKKHIDGDVVRIGYTAPNFPQETFFHGQIAEVRFYQRRWDDQEITKLAQATKDKNLVGHWLCSGAAGEAVKDISGKDHPAQVRQGTAQGVPDGMVVAGLRHGPAGAKWLNSATGDLRLQIPAGKQPLKFTLWFAQAKSATEVPALLAAVPAKKNVTDLTTLTKGGPPRWPELLTTKAKLGNDDGPFAVDTLVDPATNPWSCRMRFTGFDFLPDGKAAAVCTWDGDVWLVRGLDQPGKGLTWQRIASGLFQPLGLKIVDGQIYVGCRDQIVILRDLNGDGETDFYQNFNNDHQVTDHFHEFAMDLQTDAEGNFYYARGARHAKTPLVPHHGTLLKVSKDGSKTEIIANGFRAPNGVCLNPDGTFFVSDQEGHWNPKNRINLVVKGGFYGNMWSYTDITDTSDSAMKQPLCWITNSFDRSPSEQLWVHSKKWGALDGALLNLSYGYGKVFVIPHETINGQVQGGMIALPIPQFPTGIMRGRFHPENGQLYVCGMFAWGGNQMQPGGLYCIRRTDKALHVPIGLQAKKDGLLLTFTDALDPKSAGNAANYAVKTWALKRSANYGSKHYDEKKLPITSAKLSANGKQVFLEIPQMQPTWCMEIRYVLHTNSGQPVQGILHNTIHQLGK